MVTRGDLMTFKNLRTITGQSQKEFANTFSIPLRTYQKWEYYEDGKTKEGRKPPIYVKKMIKTILELQGYDLEN